MLERFALIDGKLGQSFDLLGELAQLADSSHNLHLFGQGREWSGDSIQICLSQLWLRCAAYERAQVYTVYVLANEI